MEIAPGVFVRAVDAHDGSYTREGICTRSVNDHFIFVLDIAIGDETFMCRCEGAIGFADDQLDGRVLLWTQQARKHYKIEPPPAKYKLEPEVRRVLLARGIPQGEIDEFETLKTEFDRLRSQPGNAEAKLEPAKQNRLDHLFRRFADSGKR